MSAAGTDHLPPASPEGQHGNAYEALNEGDDPRWAYGTGFADPLAGVDTAVPEGVDAAELAAYCLMLGDDALIMSHRLQEWCARAPELEEEVALANIALDLLGQARLLLARAGAVDGSGRDEDTLAFQRDPGEFRNVRLAEVPNGDFAHTTARLLVFATWRLALLDRLAASRDPVLAAVAAKGVKEVAYHRDYAAGWVVRLGDGTAYSRERMAEGLAAVWPLVPELFTPHPAERRLARAGVAADPAAAREEFDATLAQVLTAATLPHPAAPRRDDAPGGGAPGLDGPSTPSPDLRKPSAPGPGSQEGALGRDGAHTPALDGLLAELQSVARAHPGARW
ncbi:1,2-phenylacetyl-CoA epoxidase subunit PaaC [Sphaerisporangium sp. TRM90804]|uniref:1,2-phenylacetyl-CoA epoxidase subunit PaaC n=1 Tax=Sphaerisporangium sp. TRM90804 TaxID=3031113 RepID=UPI0024495A61|nr:1,2-phenylacetyl-CoA epoxidase subunit PaaC [Sphaerisporangium sp. TRM90804]MDH2429132.1 phenylacetate-CoA oxygenase subunit PaaC [Sphaerisporangium sp. TRM90804]